MIVLVGIAVCVVVAVLAWRRRGTRRCRWREDRAGSKGALVRYACVHCGAEAYRSTGKPKTCLATLERSRL